MEWVLVKAPSHHQGPVLSENDLGTIKIALASAASTTMDFWGRVHSHSENPNIYDHALDAIIDMEENWSSFEDLAISAEETNLVIGGIGSINKFADPRHGPWLTTLLNKLLHVAGI
jgi:hypothetical protein